MSCVQKINFKAFNSNLLQQNYVTKDFVENNQYGSKPHIPHTRTPRPPSTLSYISTCGTVASFIVGVIALKRGKQANARIKQAIG